jgi:hypothetical protein
MFGSKCTRGLVSACFAIALLPPAAHAGAVFSVYTDTSSIANQSGYIDLWFSYFAGAYDGTASITSFSTDGVLGSCGAGCTTHDASGELPGVVTISNGAPGGFLDDDYFQAITFGSYISFELTFSGPALTAPGALGSSTFTLTYYDGIVNYNPLLSADLSGASARLTIQPDNTIAREVFAAADGSFYTTLNSVPDNPSTPEPSSLALIGGGMLALAAGIARERLRRRVS